MIAGIVEPIRVQLDLVVKVSMSIGNEALNGVTKRTQLRTVQRIARQQADFRCVLVMAPQEFKLLGNKVTDQVGLYLYSMANGGEFNWPLLEASAPDANLRGHHLPTVWIALRCGGTALGFHRDDTPWRPCVILVDGASHSRPEKLRVGERTMESTRQRQNGEVSGADRQWNP